jgi:membrane-bound ClpP family serine protease
MSLVRSRTPAQAPVGLGVFVLCLAAVGWWARSAAAEAEAAPPVNGLFITVRTPITTEVASRITTKIDRFLQQPDHRGLKIVFDFNPDSYPASTSDYGPCRTLAQAILDLHDVNTIGFVHNEVTGHTVLPVLACKEIVISKGGKEVRDQKFTTEGKLGDALRVQGRDKDAELAADQRVFYQTLAERNGRSPAIVLKMADRNMEVIEGTRKGAVWYIDRNQLDEETKRGFIATMPLKVVVESGRPGLYPAEAATKFGLCSLIRETRQEVAESYGMPARSLREDPLEGRAPNACRVILRGEITGGQVETIKRRIRRAVARGANFILLQLECRGGDAYQARELADFFRELKDNDGEEPVMTVAYVTIASDDTALILALGCSEIVMDAGANLGNFETVVRSKPSYQDRIRDSVEALAREQGYQPLLFRAMFEPKLELHRVRSRKGTLERKVISGEELARDARGEQRWIDEGQLKPSEPAFHAGQWFRLDAERAKDLDVAREYFDGTPQEVVPKIYAYYGVEKARDLGSDWLDEIAAFLQLPLVGMVLITIGVTGLILELKIPGVAFPGILAATCFVLYFWANSQLSGHLTMLAVLLFVLGLILIGLEIFVVPGFGITGISGITLIIVGLALATVVKKPETTAEWVEFGSTLSHIALSLLAATGAAFLLAWYLPHIPYVNRLVLKPPSQQADADEASPLAAQEQTRALLGAVGEAITTLRPAGKVRFGDEFVDVVAEGSYVEPGTRVQVIEIEGNRVVVKPIEQDSTFRAG